MLKETHASPVTFAPSVMPEGAVMSTEPDTLIAEFTAIVVPAESMTSSLPEVLEIAAPIVIEPVVAVRLNSASPSPPTGPTMGAITLI